jgi:hypothetical protein
VSLQQHSKAWKRIAVQSFKTMWRMNALIRSAPFAVRCSVKNRIRYFHNSHAITARVLATDGIDEVEHMQSFMLQPSCTSP